jgi:hypothetical protein
VIENAAERARECLLFVSAGVAVLVGEVSAGDRGIGVDEAEASFRLKSFPKMRFAPPEEPAAAMVGAANDMDGGGSSSSAAGTLCLMPAEDTERADEVGVCGTSDVTGREEGKVGAVWRRP